MPFDSEEARQLNRDIFEAIYYGALRASCALAAAEGPYETYEGCPVSKGQLQFDMWGVEPSSRFDWPSLRQDISQHGVRNSLLLAPMPTASTSQILGNNECFEPFTSNIYVRRVLSGEFTVVNQHLLSGERSGCDVMVSWSRLSLASDLLGCAIESQLLLASLPVLARRLGAQHCER